MVRLAFVVVACAMLGACQARGFGEQFMSQQEIEAKDDTTCRSFGAAPGSQVYVDCRLRLASNRSGEMRTKVLAASM